MNHKRWYGFVALLTLLAMVFSACAAPVGPAPAQDTESGETGAVSGLKVGLITDVGRINDRSFNQSAWEGLLAAADELGLAEGDDVKYIETQDSKDYADNIQQFADAGFTVLVTVGEAMTDATNKAAADNPDIFFVGVDQKNPGNLPNMTGWYFAKINQVFWRGRWPHS